MAIKVNYAYPPEQTEPRSGEVHKKTEAVQIEDASANQVRDIVNKLSAEGFEVTIRISVKEPK